MRTKPLQNKTPTTESSVLIATARRSKRLILDLPVVIRGESEGKCAFQEKTFTLKLSAHGGLVVLENRVALGQKVLLMNPKTWDEREVTVVFLGPPYAGLSTVGVEFVQPSPEFWAISSPPADWNLS